MKKLLALVLAFVMVLSVFTACNTSPNGGGSGDAGDTNTGENDGDGASKPEANPITDFEYSVKKDSVSITGYIGTSKTVVFPDTIAGRPVTIIGGHLLDGENEMRSLIESVVIPDTVEIIAPRAFSRCRSLVSVDFGEGVREIQEQAFLYCTALKKIILPPMLESIGDGAFYGCSSAEEIFIPKTLEFWKTNLDYVFFGECDSLKMLTFEDGLETIGNYGAFTSMTLEKVVFPSSLKRLDDMSFNQCPLLKTVIFLGDAPEVGAGYVFGLYEVPENLIIYYDPGAKGWDETPLKHYTLVPLPQDQ